MKTNYGNWVPEKMLKLMWSITGLMVILVLLTITQLKVNVISMIVGGITVIVFLFSSYMQLCHWAFSFNGGKVMARIHEFLLSKLEWNGKGRLLDIGCGSGALSIRSAKKYSKAQIVGMDYWGKEWNYAKEQCEQNAEIENVVEQLTFKKGDAAKLPFTNNRFDAAVSNCVFHEVRTQPDKRLVVKEALRVVKEGGSFAFLDLFEYRSIYGDMNELIEELKNEGVHEIHYEGNLEKLDIVPWYTTAPWMLSHLGILYGKK